MAVLAKKSKAHGPARASGCTSNGVHGADQGILQGARQKREARGRKSQVGSREKPWQRAEGLCPLEAEAKF